MQKSIPSHLIIVILLVFAPQLFADDASFYMKRSTWHETMRASFDAIEAAKGEQQKQLDITIGTWYMLGPIPLDNAFAAQYAPEQHVDLTARYEDGKYAWTAHAEWQDGIVTMFPSVPRSATYVYRTIMSKRDTAVRCYLGSDDGIKVWMNDALLLSHNIDRGCEPNQEQVRLPLRTGKNRLLLKITNGGGAHGFYFSLFFSDPEILWSLVRRDFLSPEAIREMEWERADEIWDGGWQKGGTTQLSQRYERAYRSLTATLGLKPALSLPKRYTEKTLQQLHGAYLMLKSNELRIREEEKAKNIRTPKESPLPVINGPRIYGVRPESPFLYRIPATGARPMEYAAQGLPLGLTLDITTGIITGRVATPGEYTVKLAVKNSYGAIARKFRIVVGRTIALTPPLGWNSWNCFAGDVDAVKVQSAADAMVSSGLINHGWSYINIDDCWMVKPNSTDPLLGGALRDSNGTINTNKKFPDMKVLSDSIHARGLKLGIYSSPGPTTCAGYAASYQYEEKDAQQYAAWNIDYLKYDWCSYNSIAKDMSLAELQKPYRVMRAALDKAPRDIVFSLCQFGMGNVWEWGAEVGGTCWRTTGDITDTWESMAGIGFGQTGHELYAGPGHWNDPDMLVVGQVGWGPRLHPTKLTAHEQYTHITLWSLLAAPLLIGCDMTKLDAFTLNLLTNDEVLDVNQDAFGKQAHRAIQKDKCEVWVKELEDHSLAIGLFNRGEREAIVSVQWSDVGLTGSCVVRDVWRQKPLGELKSGYSVRVARHGAELIRVFSLHSNK